MEVPIGERTIWSAVAGREAPADGYASYCSEDGSEARLLGRRRGVSFQQLIKRWHVGELLQARSTAPPRLYRIRSDRRLRATRVSPSTTAWITAWNRTNSSGRPPPAATGGGRMRLVHELIGLRDVE